MRYFIRYLLFKMAIVFTCTLPPRFVYWVALRCADFAYFFADRRNRKAFVRNLRVVFPEAGEQRIIHEARWAYRNWGKYLSEFLRFCEFDEQFFLKHCSLAHPEHLADGLRRGRGVIILSAHFGNWELGAAFFRIHCGLPVTALAIRQKSQLLENLFIRERTSRGIQVAYTGDNPAPLFRALKRNEVVCILGDRDPTGGGVIVNFFGRPCRFPQGPGRLALATGCAVVPGVVLRRSNDSFSLETRPALALPPEFSGAEVSKEEKVRALTQEFAHYLEEQIRENPEQWASFYDVWDGEWQQ